MASPDDGNDTLYRTAFDVSFYATAFGALMSVGMVSAVRWFRNAAAADEAWSRIKAAPYLDVPLPLEVVMWVVAGGFVVLTLLIALPGPYPAIPVRVCVGGGGELRTIGGEGEGEAGGGGGGGGGGPTVARFFTLHPSSFPPCRRRRGTWPPSPTATTVTWALVCTFCSGEPRTCACHTHDRDVGLGLYFLFW
jgi:hypothetical protein